MTETTDFDTQLRIALNADAARAPAEQREWSGVAAVGLRTPRPRTATYAALGTIAAAAVVAVFLAFARDPDRSEPAAFQPSGTEFPMQDLGAAKVSTGGVTLAGLTRSLGVAGHMPLTVASTLQYDGGPTPFVMRCLDEGGSMGCNPEWNTTVLDIGMTSSVDNRVAAGDLWTWSNVPNGTAYVTYTDGVRSLWQRPIAGVVLFPNVAGNNEVVIAYSIGGLELKRVDRDSLAAANVAAGNQPVPQSADISQAQLSELSQLTTSTLSDCLGAAGAAFSGGTVGILPPVIDEHAVWDRCVATTKAVVARRLSELHVRFYDPRTEQPQNPDSPYHAGPVPAGVKAGG